MSYFDGLIKSWSYWWFDQKLVIHTDDLTIQTDYKIRIWTYWWFDQSLIIPMIDQNLIILMIWSYWWFDQNLTIYLIGFLSYRWFDKNLFILMILSEINQTDRGVLDTDLPDTGYPDNWKFIKPMIWSKFVHTGDLLIILMNRSELNHTDD